MKAKKMRIFDWKEEINKKELEETIRRLNLGKLVIFPTETVYAIGANGLDKNAIKKLFISKNRKYTNPINLLVSGKEMIKSVAYMNEMEEKVIDRFTPGPLTLILKKKENVPDILTANLDEVGVRIPDNEIALAILKEGNFPIAAPSANISKKISNTEINDLIEQFNSSVDLIIDGGSSTIGIESTIVRFDKNIPHILRQGVISQKDLSDLCGDCIIDESTNNNKHYQLDGKCTYLIDNNNEIKKFYDGNTLIICFDEDIESFEDYNYLSLGSLLDIEDILKNLYKNLLKIQKTKYSNILFKDIKDNKNNSVLKIKLKQICNL